MDIQKGIEIIDLALFIRRPRVLVIGDLHLGYEEALNKQGLLVPRVEFSETLKRLEAIMEKADPSVVVINGDLKHEFGTISDQEWKQALGVLDFFLGNPLPEISAEPDFLPGSPPASGRLRRSSPEVSEMTGISGISKKFHFFNMTSPSSHSDSKKREGSQMAKKTSRAVDGMKVVIVKGNHDTIIGPIAEKKDVEVVERYDIESEGITIVHGDSVPEKMGCTVIIGHEHPAVSFPGRPDEKYKCFLKGKYKSHNLIVMPSFNLLTAGTDVQRESLLSPFLKQSLDRFEVFVVEEGKVFKFGRLGRLSGLGEKE